MSNHLREDRIQDYVDDLLCHEERAEVEEHLITCAVCQADVAALRDMVSRLHSLDHTIMPERDLLAGIHQRMDIAETVSPAAVNTASHPRWSERSLRSLRVPLAAAALVLVAISAAITARLVQRDESAVRIPVVARSRDNTRAPVRTVGYTNVVDQRYGNAVDELERLLAAQRPHLTPETVRLVEENLRVIDSALAEARAALRDDPNNAALSDLMRSAYEKKLDLLRHATEARGAS